MYYELRSIQYVYMHTCCVWLSCIYLDKNLLAFEGTEVSSSLCIPSLRTPCLRSSLVQVFCIAPVGETGNLWDKPLSHHRSLYSSRKFPKHTYVFMIWLSECLCLCRIDTHTVTDDSFSHHLLHNVHCDEPHLQKMNNLSVELSRFRDCFDNICTHTHTRDDRVF